MNGESPNLSLNLHSLTLCSEGFLVCSWCCCCWKCSLILLLEIRLNKDRYLERARQDVSERDCISMSSVSVSPYIVSTL